MVAVKWIQELKSCKVSKAKEIYREAVQKLANPDIADRHEIAYGNILRGEKGNTEPGKAPSSHEPTKEKTVAEKKAKAPKKAAAKKATSEPKTPRQVVELADLTREVELTPAGEGFNGVYTANLFGKKHSVYWIDIDHADPGAAARFAPPHLSEKKLDLARKFALKAEIPLAVCVTVRVKGRVDQGYAATEELVKKFSNKMSRGRISLSMSADARLAYRQDGWDGCKFSVKESDSKAA
jgi:hypothetical protein